MRLNIYLIILLLSTSLFAQNSKDVKIPTLNDVAPSFVAQSTDGQIHFPDDYYNKWKIIFSHPADFTPVCTSEIWELAHIQDEFEKLNTKIFVLSTDGINSHLEWIKSIESIDYQGRKPVKVKFPIISDVNMTISKQYGMQHPFVNTTQNVRGVFIINPKDHIEFIAFYPSNVGRNTLEILRVLIALQESKDKDILTPVNWQPGDDFMMHAPKTREESDALKAKNNSDFYNYAWYMWFIKNKR